MNRKAEKHPGFHIVKDRKKKFTCFLGKGNEPVELLPGNRLHVELHHKIMALGWEPMRDTFFKTATKRNKEDLIEKIFTIKCIQSRIQKEGYEQAKAERAFKNTVGKHG